MSKILLLTSAMIDKSTKKRCRYINSKMADSPFIFNNSNEHKIFRITKKDLTSTNLSHDNLKN